MSNRDAPRTPVSGEGTRTPSKSTPHLLRQVSSPQSHDAAASMASPSPLCRNLGSGNAGSPFSIAVASPRLQFFSPAMVARESRRDRGATSPEECTRLEHGWDLDDDDNDNNDDDYGAGDVEDPMDARHTTIAALVRWQRITLACLISIYTGYYFCRTNLSVSLPSLLHATKISKSAFGGVISWGYAFYALGKLLNGLLIDRLGGKSILVTCLVGSIVCTFIFGSVSNQNASVSLFCVIWSLNRVFQSGGWPALTTLVRSWFQSKRHGQVMGIASLSYSLGDAVIRYFLGIVLSMGISWQNLFYLSGVCGILLLVPAIWFLHSSPVELGLPSVLDPAIALRNLQPTSATSAADRGSHSGDSQPHAAPRGCFGRIGPKSLMRRPKYLILLLQAPLFTWSREIFNSWVVVFLHEEFDLDEGTASVISLVYPLLGAISSVGGGFLVDMCPRARRGQLYFSLVLAAFFGTSGFAFVTAGPAPNQPLGTSPDAARNNMPIAAFLIGLIGLFATAPGSWAEGVFPLELAGRRNAGMAVAVVHSVGYIGAILSGHFVGDVVESHGWGRLFSLMSVAAGINAVLAAAHWYVDLSELTEAGGAMTTKRGGGGGGRYVPLEGGADDGPACGMRPGEELADPASAQGRSGSVGVPGDRPLVRSNFNRSISDEAIAKL